MALSKSISHPQVEVLSPCRDLSIGVEAVIADIAKELRSDFIETEYAKSYFGLLDNYRQMGQGVRVIGPPLSGKSKASKYYGEMIQKKTAYTAVPSNCSSRRMHERLLKAVRHAAPGSRRTDVQSKLAGCLSPFGYEMVIVDQGENLQKEALKDLTNLIGGKGIPVVVCGTRELDQFLEDIGLIDWFPNLYSFGSLTYEDFKATLNKIENEYLRLPEPSFLSEGENFQTLVIKTNTYIGKLINVIEKATFRSLKKGLRKVDSKIIQQVANEYGKRYVEPEFTLQPVPLANSTQSPPALPPQAESGNQQSKATS